MAKESLKVSQKGNFDLRHEKTVGTGRRAWKMREAGTPLKKKGYRGSEAAKAKEFGRVRKQRSGDRLSLEGCLKIPTVKGNWNSDK